MNLMTKKMVDNIDEEIERITSFQNNINIMTDQRRHELLKQCLSQYKSLLEGNKAMLTKIRG